MNKKALAAHYRDNLDIHCDSNEVERFSEIQLLIKLETRHHEKKETDAVIRIQSQVRRMICKILFIKMLEDRIKAASRI